MSFDLDMRQILQYSYNIFGSFLPMVYIFAGASIAIFILFTIINKIRGGKNE
ncbi:hypothetical protein [Brevibacillus reuszeri]|uniref:hypothetical protein n=1 Tax=Brevibacillus reuszeri TaxID=54915 RepID=UPI0013E0C972|nr:hypothetical protein [Brevibacillus reuszeri]